MQVSMSYNCRKAADGRWCSSERQEDVKSRNGRNLERVPSYKKIGLQLTFEEQSRQIPPQSNLKWGNL